MIVCLKDISEKIFSFNGHVKIINATLKFLTKVSTQEANWIFTKIKFIPPLSKAFQRSALILNQNLVCQNFFHHFSLFSFTQHIFLYLVLFSSNHIWWETWSRKVHLKKLRGKLNIQGTRRLLGDLGTRTLEALADCDTVGDSDDIWSTWVPSALGHSRHLEHSSIQCTRVLECLGTYKQFI